MQVLEMRKRVLGEEHPDTLTSIADLAVAFRDLGKLGSAVELISACASLSSASLGPLHSFTISRHQWKKQLEMQYHKDQLEGNVEMIR